MISRVLILINSAGCAALIALVVLLWSKERSLLSSLDARRADLADATNALAERDKRMAALENDITLLKDSLASTQQSAEAAARDLGEKATRVTALDTELKNARERITAWETAVKTRDGRIADLTEELLATRKRLDEAVARLRTAAKARESGN